MGNARRDENSVPTLLGVSSADGITPVTIYVDPTTHRVLTDSAGGGGMTNPMTTGGDIIYGGALGVPTRLANGNAGEVLTSQGTTLDPIWSAAGAGDMILGATQTVTGAKTFNENTLLLDGSTSGAATLNAPAIAGSAVITLPSTTTTLPGLSLANSYTTAQTITPLTDVIALTARRNNGTQTSNILEIQTEANAFLAGFNKAGGLITSSVIGNTSSDLSIITPAVTSATPAVDGIANSILITTGQATVTTPADTILGSSISMSGGHLEPSSSQNNGGDFSINGGDTTITDITDYTGAVRGGIFNMYGGVAAESTNTLTSVGALFSVEGGTINNATGLTGGQVYIEAGTVETATETGYGAVVILTGGDSTGGTTTGGSISFRRGTGDDAVGVYQFKGPTTYGVLDFESIATTDKTFTFPNATGTLVLQDNAVTITNKRNQSRTASSTTSSNLSPDLSTANIYFRTTQTATLTIDAPTGTPVIGEVITLYVDSAGAQTLTINATYKAFGAAFPATTTAGKTFMMTAMYNGTDWKTTWANAV